MIWVSMIIYYWLGRGLFVSFPFLHFLYIMKKLECPCQKKFEFLGFWKIPRFQFGFFQENYPIGDSLGSDSNGTWILWLEPKNKMLTVVIESDQKSWVGLNQKCWVKSYRKRGAAWKHQCQWWRLSRERNKISGLLEI